MSFWQKLFGKKEEKESIMEPSVDVAASAPSSEPTPEVPVAEPVSVPEHAPEAPVAESEDATGGKSW